MLTLRALGCLRDRERAVANLDLTGIQAEAMLLIVLVSIGHPLVWRFMLATTEPE